MSKGKTLVELAHALEAERGRKLDYIANTSQLHYENGEMHVDMGEVYGVHEQLTVSGHAHQQLATWAEIPIGYYRRMLKEQPELLGKNINTWLKETPADRMLRTFKPEFNDAPWETAKPDTLRAFLSNRYRRIDNWDVANAVLPPLQESHPDTKIESCELTSSRLYIKALFSDIQGAVKVGDIVQSGVMITNSEIGVGKLRVSPFLGRLVCSNGMVVNDYDGAVAYSRTHIGAAVTADDNGAFQYYSDATLELDDKALLAKVADVVRGSRDEVLFQAQLRKLQKAADSDPIEQPTPAVRVLAERLNLTQGEGASVLENLLADGDFTKWGAANAVTRLAHDVVDYDRATELQGFGHKVVTMPKGEWETIRLAA